MCVCVCSRVSYIHEAVYICMHTFYTHVPGCLYVCMCGCMYIPFMYDVSVRIIYIYIYRNYVCMHLYISV